MELDLEELCRDWIVGISGAAFGAKVRASAEVLTAIADEERCRGVLITETDPIEFAAVFFGAVMTDTPVILGNPKWGQQEWAELGELVAPVKVFGPVGLPPFGGAGQQKDRLNAGLQLGSILIPTGGTTGGVKLAIHNWESLVAASVGVQAFLGGGPIDSCCLLPLYHVSGLMQLVRSFVSGGKIRFDDAEIEGYCLSLVPTQLQRLLGNFESIDQLGTARAIFVGGAALPAAVAKQARAHKLPIIPVYGMTETGAMCAAVPVEDFLRDPSAGAVPIGGARFVVEDGGHIRIYSTALFKGYQGRESMDVSQGYLTGDLGRIDPSGRLHVEGRADRIIISGGEKIDPREVEAAISALPGVATALAVGLPDAEWGQKLVVFYTGAEVADWKEPLQASLANYKIPKRLIRVDALPLDERGKFNRAVVSYLT